MIDGRADKAAFAGFGRFGQEGFGCRVAWHADGAAIRQRDPNRFHGFSQYSIPGRAFTPRSK